MKTVGIAAEYNPFHSGHAHLIERARAQDGAKASHVVAVMSGHFVQRGAPAVLPKAERVKMALASGVDLVIELPTPWALSSAEGFARGCVSLLEALGCVDVMAFGSECGQVDTLQRVARLMNKPRFGELLRYRMSGGASYPEAQQKALTEMAGSGLASVLEDANNTLGIEYIRAMTSLQPFTVMRAGAGHDAEVPLDGFASASLLRQMIGQGRLTEAMRYMPANARPILSDAKEKGWCPATESTAERALLARLRTLSPADFGELPAVSEGLENRIAEAARQATSYEDLIDRIKTKRYPRTRICRAVWCAYLGITAEDAAGVPPYVRVLGVTEKGLELVRAARRSCTLPIITRTAQAEQLTGKARRIWELEAAAADLYALALPTPFPCGREYTTGVIKYGAEDI
ncbi:MAG: nucleotidyltransferase family protein [Clostridia bacterium]|nr:nucleotidyltransferase family protein [Clostridia bacterium]